MVDKIREFFRHGVLTNVWLWFHMLFGGIFAYFCKIANMDCYTSLLSLLLLAILWEVYEYISDNVENVYGGIERFLYDSIGDVIGAMIIAALVLC